MASYDSASGSTCLLYAPPNTCGTSVTWLFCEILCSIRLIPACLQVIVVDVEDRDDSVWHNLTPLDGGLSGWRLLWDRWCPIPSLRCCLLTPKMPPAYGENQSRFHLMHVDLQGKTRCWTLHVLCAAEPASAVGRAFTGSDDKAASIQCQNAAKWMCVERQTGVTPELSLQSQEESTLQRSECDSLCCAAGSTSRCRGTAR